MQENSVYTIRLWVPIITYSVLYYVVSSILSCPGMHEIMEPGAFACYQICFIIQCCGCTQGLFCMWVTHLMFTGDSWEGNWQGVECRFQGDEPKSKPRVVTNIHIPDRKLGGPVPMSISLLKDLIELDMDGNNLSGPMNPYIGCLSNMRELDIANNSLSGNIPTEWRFMTKWGNHHYYFKMSLFSYISLNRNSYFSSWYPFKLQQCNSHALLCFFSEAGSWL